MLDAVERRQRDIAIAADARGSKSSRLTRRRLEPLVNRPVRRNQDRHVDGWRRLRLPRTRRLGAQIAGQDERTPHDRRPPLVVGRRIQPQRFRQCQLDASPVFHVRFSSTYEPGFGSVATGAR